MKRSSSFSGTKLHRPSRLFWLIVIVFILPIVLFALYNQTQLQSKAYSRKVYSRPGLETLPGKSRLGKPVALQPDLTIDSPTRDLSCPISGSTCNLKITFNVKNSGEGSATNGFKVYLYVLPASTGPFPPDTQTPDSNNWTYGIDLPAGQKVGFEYTTSKPQGTYVIYLWVDKNNEVAEINETNNIQALSTDPCITTNNVCKDRSSNTIGSCCGGLSCQAITFDGQQRCAASSSTPTPTSPPTSDVSVNAYVANPSSLFRIHVAKYKLNDITSKEQECFSFSGDEAMHTDKCTGLTNGAQWALRISATKVSESPNANGWQPTYGTVTKQAVVKPPDLPISGTSLNISLPLVTPPAAVAAKVTVNFKDSNGNAKTMYICGGTWSVDAQGQYTGGSASNCDYRSSLTTQIQSYETYAGIFIVGQPTIRTTLAVPSSGFITTTKNAPNQQSGIYMGWPKWTSGERTIDVTVSP